MQLSIVITNHNQAECVMNLLSLIASDDLTDAQIIVADDYSCHDDFHALSTFVDKWAKDRMENGLPTDITTFTLDSWGGAGGARNAGYARAEGRYIWFVDGDDEIIKGGIHRIVEHLKKTEAEIVLLPYSEGADLCHLSTHNIDDIEVCPKPYQWRIAPWGKLIRRDKFIAFAERCLYEDTDWHYLVCDNCHTRDFVRGRPVYIYWSDVPGSQMFEMRNLTDHAIAGRVSMVGRILSNLAKIRSSEIKAYCRTFAYAMLETVMPKMKENSHA